MTRHLLKAALVGALVITPAVAQQSHGQAHPRGAHPRVVAPFTFAFSGDGGYLGVTLESLTPETAKTLGLEAGTKGARIEKVLPDGPAAKAGLKDGDVIVAVDGVLVAGSASVREWIADRKPGDRVKLDIIRSGARQSVELELGERTMMKDFALTVPELGDLSLDGRLPEGMLLDGTALPDGRLFRMIGGGPKLGVAVMPLSDQLRDYFGVEKATGVLVSGVSPASAAGKAGIRAGDVIVSVDGQPIDQAGDIGRILRAGSGTTRTVRVEIVRDHKRMTLDATVEAPAVEDEE